MTSALNFQESWRWDLQNVTRARGIVESMSLQQKWSHDYGSQVYQVLGFLRYISSW